MDRTEPRRWWRHQADVYGSTVLCRRSRSIVDCPDRDDRARLRTAALADPNKRFLDTAAGLSAYVWALERGLRFAAATAVVALAASTLFSGADAERFATTAYLAAIVAALALMLRWFVREVHPPQGERGPLFPAILTFVLWLAFFIGAGITLDSQPGAALPTIVAAFGLIAIAALVRGGALLKLCTKLSGGDRLSAVTRFAAAA